MSKNDHTHQHEDVMQAIVSALLFGEKAGLAAIAEYYEDDDPEIRLIHPEGGSVLHVTAEAAGMLAEAQEILFDAREEGILDVKSNRIGHYLLTDKYAELFDTLFSDALGKDEEPDDEAVEIDMSEVTPGNTEKVYTDQPIPKKEA